MPFIYFLFIFDLWGRIDGESYIHNNNNKIKNIDGVLIFLK